MRGCGDLTGRGGGDATLLPLFPPPPPICMHPILHMRPQNLFTSSYIAKIKILSLENNPKIIICYRQNVATTLFSYFANFQASNESCLKKIRIFFSWMSPSHRLRHIDTKNYQKISITINKNNWPCSRSSFSGVSKKR